MSADRELLELAAKANGFIDDAVDGSEAHGLHRDAEGLFYWVDANGWAPWVPADDDGQALRLAVKLRLEVAPGCYFPDQVEVYMHDRNPVAELFGTDELAATRRAIVRAAAEIGKAMP